MNYITMLLAVILLTGCGSKHTEIENNTATTKEPEAVIRLSAAQLQSFEHTIVTLEKRAVARTVRLNGKADVPPQSMVSLSNALGGYVQSINLLPGTSFKKGQLLLVLEDNQFIQLQQDYLTTKAQLKSAELNYQRQKELNESKAASDKSYQLAEAEYQSLRITKKALEEKLKLININPDKLSVATISRSVNLYAPFDGVVSKVLVNKGRYTAPSDILLELINPADLLLNLKVFEKDLSQVAVGQTIKAYTNEQPDVPFTAEIITVSRNINEDGTADIHARLKETAGAKIVPGIYVNAQVETLNGTSYTLPEASVLSFEGKSYVFEVLNKSTFKLVPVTPGDTNDGFVEIQNSAGLQGKSFVAKNAYTLLMGLKNKSEN